MDFESCFLTPPVAAAGVIIPASTLSVSVAQPPQQNTALKAGRHSSAPFYGNKVITGTMTGPVGEESIGFILKAYLGTPDSTAVHTFTVQETTPSFILSKEFTDLDKYYIYSGCKATTLSFIFNNNNELLYNLGFMAAEELPQGTPYMANPEDLSSELFYSNPEIGTGDVEEGGSATDIFEEITINLNDNPTMAYGLSAGGFANYASDGKLECTGTIRGVFVDDSILVKGIAHTESSLDIKLSKTVNYIRFLIPELQWSQESPNITGPGIVELNLTFIGYFQDGTEDSDIVIYLNNNRPDYS
jgi:hypothetical protein